VAAARPPAPAAAARCGVAAAPRARARARAALRAVPDLRHVTADLAAPASDLRVDVQRLDLPDAAFGAVLCSHVLEHVPDDRAAMRELRRVLRPDGWALVAVPQSPWRAVTFEDPSATGADERLRTYGQADHVRQYGDDIAERLRDAGFAVQTLWIAALAGPRAARRHGLLAPTCTTSARLPSSTPVQRTSGRATANRQKRTCRPSGAACS
jgi:SAM-dependent methyltransferase